jgi:hypothetical protein
MAEQENGIKQKVLLRLCRKDAIIILEGLWRI